MENNQKIYLVTYHTNSNELAAICLKASSLENALEQVENHAITRGHEEDFLRSKDIAFVVEGLKDAVYKAAEHASLPMQFTIDSGMYEQEYSPRDVIRFFRDAAKAINWKYMEKRLNPFCYSKTAEGKQTIKYIMGEKSIK